MIECQKKALGTIGWSHWETPDEVMVQVHCELRDKPRMSYAAVLLSKAVEERAKPTSDDLIAALLWKLCKGCPILRQEDDHETD